MTQKLEKIRSGLAAKPVTDTINALIDQVEALQKLIVGEWVDFGEGELVVTDEAKEIVTEELAKTEALSEAQKPAEAPAAPETPAEAEKPAEDKPAAKRTTRKTAAKTGE